MKKLIPPCSYQGGKQRLAKQIVDIFYEENDINDNTKFFDICCGSGSISLEMINRGFNPNNITMIDSGCYGAFWQSIANEEFELSILKNEIDKLPSIENIKEYLYELSCKEIDEDLSIYHYLLLQSGSFGSKQIWTEDNKWKNNSFRDYWKPTETSNRRSIVNPMMPMPNSLYERVCQISLDLSGCIRAINADIFRCLHIFDELKDNNAIVYIDPPYQNTTKYKNTFNIYELILTIWNNVPIYVSEGHDMNDNKKSWLLSEGRSKGNISGNITKNPIQEWLNKF